MDLDIDKCGNICLKLVLYTFIWKIIKKNYLHLMNYIIYNTCLVKKNNET